MTAVRAFFSQLMNVPNSMSLFRLLTAPLLVVFWVGLDMNVLALSIGTLGGITDLFDGWVARRLGQETEIGAVIDQLGDLMFESFCLLIGIVSGDLWVGWILLYLFREFTVTSMRSYVSARGGRLPSSPLGKTKSSLYQWAFFSLFLGAILQDPGVLPASWSVAGVRPGELLIGIATFAIGVGVLVGLISGASYARAFARFYAERAGGRGGASGEAPRG